MKTVINLSLHSGVTNNNNKNKNNNNNNKGFVQHHLQNRPGALTKLVTICSRKKYSFETAFK